MITKLVQISKTIAYVGRPPWLHTLIHLLLYYLPPISGVPFLAEDFVESCTLSRTAMFYVNEEKKKDLKTNLS